MKRLVHFLLILLIFSSGHSYAIKSLSKNSVAQAKVEWVLEKVYNYEFAAAKQRLKYFEKEYKDHPVYPLLQSQIIAYGMIQSKDPAREGTKYMIRLQQALTYAKVMLKEDKKDPEAIFFNLAAYGFMALHYSDTDQPMKAAGVAKKAYGLMRDGYKLKEKYPEFYFSAGLYDYFVVQYPKTHPLVKPLLLFFPGGDKKLGIQEIKVASKKGRFTKFEATYFLGHIYGKYEMDQTNAIKTFGALVTKFPRNTYFRIRYAESLLFAKKYTSAKRHIDMILFSSYSTFKDVGRVLNGIYEEAYLKKYDKAIATSKLALTKLEGGNIYAGEYVYFAYACLARAYDKKGNKDYAKKYYKKVSSDSEYEELRKESKAYLKAN